MTKRPTKQPAAPAPGGAARGSRPTPAPPPSRFGSRPLADFVEASEGVLPRAQAIATSIAAKPPVNVRLAKRMIADVHDEVVRRGLRSEALALTAIYHTDDYTEARAARREGRPATFTGR